MCICAEIPRAHAPGLLAAVLCLLLRAFGLSRVLLSVQSHACIRYTFWQWQQSLCHITCLPGVTRGPGTAMSPCSSNGRSGGNATYMYQHLQVCCVCGERKSSWSFVSACVVGCIISVCVYAYFVPTKLRGGSAV